MEHLLEIINYFGGNKTALSTAIRSVLPASKICATHINNWIGRDKKIPSDMVIPLCVVVNFKKTPHQLRPDLYPHPDDGLPDHMRSAA